MPFLQQQRTRSGPQARSTQPRIIKKAEFVGLGALVQFVGLILCFVLFPIGLLAGLVLLVAGGRMAIVRKCSECRNKVPKDARVCSACGARFP
jgi:hypothetical protein